MAPSGCKLTSKLQMCEPHLQHLKAHQLSVRVTRPLERWRMLSRRHRCPWRHQSPRRSDRPIAWWWRKPWMTTIRCHPKQHPAGPGWLKCGWSEVYCISSTSRSSSTSVYFWYFLIIDEGGKEHKILWSQMLYFHIYIRFLRQLCLYLFWIPEG